MAEMKSGTYTNPDGTVVTFNYTTNPRAFDQQNKYSSSAAWDEQGAPPPPPPQYDPSYQAAPMPPQYSGEPYYPPPQALPGYEAAPMPPQYTSEPYYPAPQSLPGYQAAPIPPQYSGEPYYPPPQPPSQPPYIPTQNTYDTASSPQGDASKQVYTMPGTHNGLFDATIASFMHQGWTDKFAETYNVPTPTDNYYTKGDFYVRGSSPTTSWVVAPRNDGYASAELVRAQPTYSPILPPPNAQPAVNAQQFIPQSGGMATAASADNATGRYRPDFDYTSKRRDNRRQRNNRRGR